MDCDRGGAAGGDSQHDLSLPVSKRECAGRLSGGVVLHRAHFAGVLDGGGHCADYDFLGTAQEASRAGT